MSSKHQLPLLPHGSPSIISGLSESLSFHSSPEAFITSRVLAFRSSNPYLAENRVPIRAKVLNRNVAVVSSYRHVQQILSESLDNDCPFSAREAYSELMAAFFPDPNLLLSDPPLHCPMRKRWDDRVELIMKSSGAKCEDIAITHFHRIENNSSFDIYESMKELSWKILLSLFLTHTEDSSSPTRSERGSLSEIERQQEVLLRGQFSLFPVSINARWWRSPRSKGLEASRGLLNLFRERLREVPAKGLFIPKNAEEQEDIAKHTLLFTSSLAVKALASLLTATLLNLYVYRGKQSSQSSLAENITALPSETERNNELLRSICLETERLSPPVVGIMRRTTRDIVLGDPHEINIDKQILVPKGWDIWLYFVGAARDPVAFDTNAETFTPRRYCTCPPDKAEVKEGFAFGSGSKACLGKYLMREVILTVAKACLGLLPRSENQDKYVLHTNFDDIPPGVGAWLGWQPDVGPEQWAKDMKQLPTQRPVKEIKVRMTRESVGAAHTDLSIMEWFDAQEYLD
ncbi:MAG: hypothetical protein HETSPECPRED_003304 [Heterodermia speciosa]|uniref:Cytochrome P450 n=1 Tax=Heterodermia speciosa TaxID=116794 RepID=A0A8H3HVE3_9LECA|nr:MAG: hypothetical protein HETSPECPRED_003304 [Heterodermia speciosa]